MKRSYFKRKTGLTQKTPLRASKTPLRRSTLAKVGKDDVAQCKVRIQALLRQIVIKRDGGCILRPQLPFLPFQFQTCDNVLQAEHLNTRSRSISFADTRNIVCLCRKHHLYFKPQHSHLYWELVEKLIPPKQWAYYKQVRDDYQTYRMTLWDWQKAELGLKQELDSMG